MELSPAQLQLLDSAIGGDIGATERLLLTHYDWLRWRIEKRIPEDLQGLVNADDILQETFIRAFSAIGRFKAQGNASFSAWLGVIADRFLIDSIKRRRRERRVEKQPVSSPSGATESNIDGLIDQVADKEKTPQREAMLAELRRLLPVALAQLPQDQREVLRFRYLEGLSLDEAAAATGHSTDSVRGLSHRARKQLREVLVRLSSYI